MLVVRQISVELRQQLEQDAALVRTGISAASAYGWHELGTSDAKTWSLDAYVTPETFSILQEQLNQLDLDTEDTAPSGSASDSHAERVLLRVVEDAWPFPPHYPLAPQPLAALDLLDYPDDLSRRIAREVLGSVAETNPIARARRSAKARAVSRPVAAGSRS